MKKIYLLEFNRYYYKDNLDNEDVEDRYTVGYFSSKKLAQNAINICLYNKELRENEFFITRLPLNYTKNQKYVYVLNYEFSILNKNDEYEDFYYKFAPCTSKRGCKRQKNNLLLSNNFNKRTNAIYDVSKDGFYIDKFKINYIKKIIL